MNRRIAIGLAAAAVLFGNCFAFSAETNEPPTAPTVQVSTNSSASTDEVKNALTLLVARIKAKLQLGKSEESDFADIIKDFDALLEKYPKADDARLNILFEKGRFYLAALGDPIKALPVFQQINTEYPSIVINENTAIFLANLKEQADAKRIQDSLAPGTPFPDFNEKDLLGNDLSISKYKGKVVLVDFWATWCGPCVAELPEIQSVYNKYHSKGFEIVGVSLDEGKGALEKFVKQKKMPWPQYFEGKRFDGKLPTKYGVDATPTTYLIDREGKIIKRVADPTTLEAEVANALKKS